MSTEPLFQNHIIIQATQRQVIALLTDLKNLPLWDNEITQVTPTATGAQIGRQSPALNTREQLTVSATPHQVQYHSQGGRLAYHLAFTLTESADQTAVTESLTLSENPALPVPLSLLAPIAKRAFAQKLQALATLAETLEGVTD